MARTIARLQVSIWNSEDWRSLPSVAQWLYWTLLTQSRLSLAGCVDYNPHRWAGLAPDLTPAVVEHALEVLEGSDYVSVDRATGEVVIRTFTTHDLAAGNLNGNLVKGFWQAWLGILSADLRHVVVLALPDRVWEWKDAVIPTEAEQLRRSPRLEPTVTTAGLDSWSGPSLAVTSAVTSAAAEPVAATVDEKITAAARLLAAAEIERRGPHTIGNHEGYTRSRLPQLTEQNLDRWRSMLEADPAMTPEQLAAPPVAVAKAPTYVQHEETVVAASEARYAMAERIRAGEVCRTCRGTGQYLPDDSDTIAPCPCRDRN